MPHFALYITVNGRIDISFVPIPIPMGLPYKTEPLKTFTKLIEYKFGSLTVKHHSMEAHSSDPSIKTRKGKQQV